MKTSSIRKNFKLIASNIIWICVAAYFVFHIFTGARGAVSWARLSREVTKLESELKSLQEENSFLENKIKLLRDNNLDLDLLQEQAMNILGYANANDIIVLLPQE